jgi:hypothetical protein
MRPVTVACRGRSPRQRSCAEPRRLLLRVFVEGTDSGSSPVPVQLDDIEHAVAVLTSIEQCVASGDGE